LDVPMSPRTSSPNVDVGLFGDIVRLIVKGQ